MLGGLGLAAYAAANAVLDAMAVAAGSKWLSIDWDAWDNAGEAQNVAGGVLTPALLYGTTRVRSLSVGLRAGWGMAGHRMGRYGALLETGHQPGMSHDRWM